MREHNVDNKEANWNRMNSAEKRISQVSSQGEMMEKQPHTLDEKRSQCCQIP